MWFTCRAQYDSKWWIMMLLTMSSVCFHKTAMGWIFDPDSNVVLSEGDSCRIRTGEPGRCTLLEKCDPYYKGLQKKTIEYSFLVRCSLIRFKEVICCPLSETPPKTTQPQVATTTTTTTMRPIVIGGVTFTGNEEFVDLSKILRRTSTSTSTTTTRRPRQNRLENGINVQWPNARTSDAEWIDPNSRNIVQFPLQPTGTNSQSADRNLNEALTDLLGPFQFRPNSEDPLLAGTSTLRTIVRNELDEASNVWAWSEVTTPRTTTTSTTAVPDWMQPVLPDWMKAALSSSSTTQRPQTAEPILPDWMQAALDNATTAATAIRDDTTLSPVIETSVSVDPCLQANQTDSITNKTSCVHTTQDPQIDVRFPDIPGTTGSAPTTVRTVTTRNENERPSQAACRRYASFNQGSLTFHILDGIPVAPGDFPHMGALVYPSEGAETINVRCGSSLISEQYVMTAAHCVNDPVSQPIMVRFGVVQLTSTDDGIFPVDVNISSIIVHPDYRSPRRYHDIAIIRLQTPVEYTPFIRPACLYSELADIDSSTQLTVIGWGVTDVQTRSRSGILLAANLTSVPLLECNRSYIEVGVSRSLIYGLDEGQYCAFDAGLSKDACQSDSGGPLQLVRNRESSIVGVVSFGQSCASTTPSVYARVAYYLSWIESVVWPVS